MAYFVKLILVFSLFFPFSSYAGALLSVPFRASTLTNVVKASSGVVGSVGYVAQTVANSPVYASKAVPIAKSVLGALISKRVFTPWGFALAAAVSALGYIVNDTDKVIGNENNTDYSSLIGGCTTPFNFSIGRTFSECVAYASQIMNVNYTPTDVTNLGGRCYLNYTGGYLSLNGYSTCPSMNINDYIDGSSSFDIVDPEVLYDKITQNMTDQEVVELATDLLTDPVDGLPNSNIDFADAPQSSPNNLNDPITANADNLSQNYNAENDDDPLTEPIELADVTEFKPEKKEEKQEDVCKVNPDSLMCSQLGEADAAIDIVNEVIPFSYSPVSLAGSAVCPTSQTYTLSKGLSFSIDNQPICDFASGIRGIVIAVCTLSGLMIVVGGIRNG